MDRRSRRHEGRDKIEVIENEEKTLVKTSNNFLMEHTADHANDKKIG